MKTHDSIYMIKRKLPIPLRTQYSELLSLPLDKRQPPEPIIEINDDYCAINNNAASVRNYFFIPWLLALLLTGYWFFDSHVLEWQKAETDINRFIHSNKTRFGEDYFQFTEDEIALSLYNRISQNGELSFTEFLDYRYTSFVDGGRQKIIDGTFFLLFLLGIPFLIFWIVRFPRLAPLYFEQKNQRVFTWRKGKVWVQRFEDLRINEDIHALTFALRGELSYGVIGWYKFLVQPFGNPFINNVDNYKPILACIVQYMKNGKTLVYQNGDFNSKKKPFYFYEDKKPDNFDEQVNYILRYIDQNKDEPPLDDQGYPLEIDLKALEKSKFEEIQKNKKKGNVANSV